MTDVDVAIVGAGPVGLALALLLHRRGVGCAVLEARAGPHRLPRAVHLDDEAQEVLAVAGVEGAFGLRPVEGMSLVDRHLDPFVVIDRVERPLGRPQSALMHQPDLEEALWARAAPLVRPGRRVTGVTEGEQAVTVSVEGGRPLTARWAVGCDGASSSLRRLAGIGVEDLGFRQRWLVVDLRVSGGDAHPPRVLQICDPSRPATSVPVGRGRHRFELRARDAEADDDLLAGAGDQVAGWARRLGLRQGEVERAAVYEFRGRVARTFRDSRVLLAGDAAHEMPPFLGQGLCTGLRDAANLAWKLAWVIDGRASDTLLDTYTAERQPHARRAATLTAAVGRVVSDRRPARAALRNRALSWGERLLPARSLGRLEVPGLPPGPLVERAGRAGRAGRAERAGRPLGEHPRRALGGLPDGFAVVGVGVDPRAGLPPELRRWWEGTGTTFHRIAADDAEGRGALLVVRPDGFVLGSYRSPGEGQASPLADLAVRLSGVGLLAPR